MGTNRFRAVPSSGCAGPQLALDVADYVENEASPPPELLDAWDATSYGALPEAGGLLDQPMGYILRMTIANNVYQAFRGMRDANDIKQWADSNKQAWAIVGRVKRIQQERQNGSDPR